MGYHVVQIGWACWTLRLILPKLLNAKGSEDLLIGPKRTSKDKKAFGEAAGMECDGFRLAWLQFWKFAKWSILVRDSRDFHHVPDFRPAG